MQQRVEFVRKYVEQNCTPFRAAWSKLQGQPIWGSHLSQHEWCSGFRGLCQMLLLEVLGQAAADEKFQGLLDETVYARTLASLTAEANVAAELFPTLQSLTGSDLAGGKPDPITYDEIAKLADVGKKAVQNLAAKWKKEKPAIGDTSSYAVIRPFLLKHWSKREIIFPAEYEELRQILQAR